LIASCAVDPAGATDEPTSSVDEEITLDKCATGHDANASLLFNGTTDMYTRSNATIDTICHCAAWQKDANQYDEDHANAAYPDCRPSTYVDIDWDVWLSALVWEVEVPSWSLTNGDTECSNSTLAINVFDETSPGVWTQSGPQQNYHPHPLGNGVCSPLQITGGGTTANRRRIHARATRGLAEYNHGYETVKVYAYGYNVPG
jgi:hypothetical protein